MKLEQDKLIVDSKATFGELLFMEFNRDHLERDEDGREVGEVQRRSYNLYSKRQGEIIRVFIPAEVPKRNFKEEELVELEGVRVVSMVDDGFRSNRTYYITAEDLVKAGEKGQSKPVTTSHGSPTAPNQQNTPMGK